MPQYPNLVIDADLSISGVGQLSNARIQNVTSAGRLTLQQELITSEAAGNTHAGQIIFDVDIQTLFIFVSANSQFEPVSFNQQGDVMFKGVINPTNANTNTTAGAQSGSGSAGTDSDSGSTSTTTADIITNSSNALLLMDASSTADGSVIDGSSNSHSITVNGDVSQSSFSPYRSGGYSWGFDGSGDQLSFSDAGFGTGDFTVEGWVFPEDQSNRFPIAFSFGDTISVQYDHEDVPGKFRILAGNTNLHTADNNPSGQWYHIAAVRASGTLTLYVNGVAAASVTYTDNLPSYTAFIGGNSGVSSELSFKGKLSDVRYTGAAVYTADFDVPTERLTELADTSQLICNLPYMKSGVTVSGDATAVPTSPYDYAGYSEEKHGGSYIFDGSGDYLSMPASSEFDFGASDFTIETWVNVDLSSINYNLPIVGWGNGSYKIIRLNSSGINVESPNPSNTSFNVPFPSGTPTRVWNHIALVRSGNTFTAYLNGKSGTPYTSFTGSVGNSSDSLNIGYKSDPAYYPGLISDLRIVKGTAVYTADFIPTTAPLTAVTGTSLLLSGNNAELRDETQSIESFTGTDISVVSESPFNTETSIAFDGNGDYISVPSSDSLVIGSGDFTFETWIKFDTIEFQNRYLRIAEAGPYTDSTGTWRLGTTGQNTQLGLTFSGSSINSNDNLSLNEWHHVAVSRSGTTVAMFIDGVKQTQTMSSSANIDTALTHIGTQVTPETWFHGEMADLRLVKGTAVYTETFTPPTEELTAVAGTSLLISGNGGISDASTSAHSLTLNGDVTTTVASPYASYKSFNFNGSSSTISIANPQVPSLDADWTMEAWVKIDDVSGVRSIMARGFGDSGGFLIWVQQNRLRARLYPSVGSNVSLESGNFELSNNTWHHVAVSLENGTVRTFLDGVLDQERTTVISSSASFNSTDPFEIGVYNGASARFGGEMADVRVIDGEAIYTANFDVPTAPLGDYSETTTTTSSGSGDTGGTTTSSSVSTQYMAVQSSVNNIVYVYDANDLTAAPTEVPTPDTTNANVEFGNTLAITDEILVAGVSYEQSQGWATGAAYVYDMTDLTAAPTKLTAPDASAGEQFSFNAIVIDGDEIIIGSNNDNGNNGTATGAVYVFNKTDLSAAPTRLVPSDAAFDDWFGNSVAVTDSYLIVGAPFDDDAGTTSGSVYVYDRSDYSAAPTKLVPNALTDFSRFGYSIAAEGNGLVVGAYTHNNTGAAFVYDLSDLSTQPTDITPSGLASGDHFGFKGVEISDSIIAIGSRLDDTVAENSGAVYVYDRSDLSAVPTKLTSTELEANSRFGGNGIVIEGTKLIVGCQGDDSTDGLDTGSVFIYDTTDLTAAPTILQEPTPSASSNFGAAIALSAAVTSSSTGAGTDSTSTGVGTEGALVDTSIGGIFSVPGFQYVVDTAGTLVRDGVTFHPNGQVEVGDIVLFTSATEAYVLQSNVSPATIDKAGTINLATQAAVDAGVIDSDAVTPATFAGSQLAAQIAQNTTDQNTNATNIASLQTFTGEGTALSTSATDLAAAINELVGRADSSATEIDGLEALVGEGTILSTTATSLAGGLNELVARQDSSDAAILATEADIASLQTFTGEGTSLDTTAADLAAAINELHGEIVTNASEIAANTADIAPTTASILVNTNEIAANAIEIDGLTTRIDNIDSDMAVIQNTITSLYSQVASNDTDIATIFSTFGSNDSELASLVARMLTAEGNIIANDSDILALQPRITSVEGNHAANDSDILANSALIASLETYFGSDSLNTSAITLAGAINELHGEVDSNTATLLGHDSDILGLQTLFGSGPLSTTATTLAGAINELQGEITANDSDIAVLTGQISTVESQDDVKAYNQDNITFVADVEQTINHNLGLEFITGFTIAVMDGTGDMIEATIRALDSNSIGIMTEFDVSNASMFMLANLSAPAQGDIPPGTVMTQSGGYVVTQGGVYVVLNGYTGGGTSTESGTDSSSPAPAPAPEPEPEPEPEAVVISNSSEVTLLLDASVSGDDTVIDDSPSAHSVTVNGDVTQSSFSPYRSGGYSQEFSTGYISKTADDDSFNFGSDDFTVEMWFNAGPQAANYPGLFSGSNYNVGGSASFRFDNLNYDQKVWLYINGVGDPAIVTTNTYEYYQWHHTALVRNGTDLSIYVNGVQDASITISASQNINFDAGEFRMGRGFDVDGGNGYFNGKIAGVRAVRGTAVYTSNFTVPTSSPTDIAGTELLTCHLPYVVDGSSNNHGLTLNGGVSSAGSTPYDRVGYSEAKHGGSIVFGNADGNSLSMTGSADFQLDADFTLESWVNITDNGKWQPLAMWGNGHYKAIRIAGRDTSITEINIEYPDTYVFVTHPTPVHGTGWHHIAIVRSGSTITLYVDGVAGNTVTLSNTIGTTEDFKVGYHTTGGGNHWVDGSFADYRLVKGTAVYTTDFTPPTAPLTAVTGTSLLLAGTNASYRDQTQGVKSMSMEGNVAVESSSPFAGQRSLTFDGSGDRVVMESDALAFGTGDYTVEGWAYLDSVGYYKIIITTRPDNGGYADAFSVQVDNNTGQLFLYSNAFDMKSPSSVPVGQWFHYAVTRENSLTRMFLDGVEVNSGTLTKNYARTLVGVGDFPVTMSEPWVGEIGEIRVTKGLARYTSDFTPPTGPLGEYTEAPNVAPTISGIDASYTLVSGMDTVITGVATDLHNDPVTWSYAVTSGSLGDTTVTQADNVFTITPGTADATFQLTFTATDDNGNASTVASDFTHVYVEPTYTQTGLVLHLDAANPASYSGSGNWIDLTGNGGDATLNNGMAFDAADEGSFTVDGVDDFAQFPSTALVSGNGAFTNEFWFKWSGAGGNQVIFGYGNDTGPNAVNVSTVTNNKFRFEFGSGAGIADSTTTINTGTWYHAVATYDQSSIKVYINGVLEATTAYSSANVPLSGYNGENGSIGALFSTWGNVSAGGAKRYGTFGGNVAVVRQYNRALNGTEIQFNYDASKDRYDQVVLNLDASDPASYSGSGTTWTDLAGSNDATLVNGVTYDNGSMVFDGVDDYVTVPSTLTIGDTFTYSAWIKADSLTGRSAIFSTRNPNSGDGLWQLEVGEADGPNRVGISIPGVWAYTSSDNVISTNTWHYITVVKADASTNFQVFVDGVSQGFASQSVSTSGNNNTRVIGAGVNAIYDFFDGRMGSIVMHDKALTEAEIQFNYNASRNTYNDAPTISGIDASYTLATGSDTVITGVATDPEGDAVTWTYAVSSGSLEDTTVTQADNVFTVTPGSLDATFQLTFTATDAAGKVSTHVSDFTYVYAEPVAEAQHIVVSDFRYNSNNGRISIYDANNLSASPTIVEGTASGRFGKTSSYGATLFVGAPFEATQTGALYVYDDINDTSSYSTKLTAYDGGSGDYFGQSSSANGTYLAVGAEYASTNGAVYVFDRNDYSAQPTKIVSPSSSNTARFGFNVKMNQTHLFVSAPGYNTEGAVFAYDLSDLTAPPIVFNSQEGEYGAQFGAAIDVSDTHLLITCPDDDTIASNAGAGFVYDLSDMSAAPTKLTPADSGANDRIGYESGAISNTHVAFGGIYHDPSGILNAGGVWVYDLTNLSAAPTKVTGPNPTSQDQFGRSVNIGGNTMLVGEHATWSAYVFDLTDLSAAPTTLSSGLTSGGFGEGPNAIVTY